MADVGAFSAGRVRDEAREGGPVLWLKSCRQQCVQQSCEWQRKARSKLDSLLSEEHLMTAQKASRSLQFWTKSIQIYGTYKVCQARTRLISDPVRRDQVWEAQHEQAADALYQMCIGLGGFFLKAGQFLAKPDLVPMAWVKRLSVLQDAAPADDFPLVKRLLEKELGGRLDTFFQSVDERPVGSASVAQVHRAWLRDGGKEVAVKVQHAGIEPLMMMDLSNYKSFAAFLQKVELPFDVVSIIGELEDQVKHEFDFRLEAQNMLQIGDSLALGNRKTAKSKKASQDRSRSPIIVPRPVPGMVTRQVLVMDFIRGVQIMRLGDEMKRRGIKADGPIAKLARRNILRDLSAAYGHMILRDGHFQADPHPGNILICEGGKVALLDYGQTKRLPRHMQLTFAQLVLAIAADDVSEIGRLFGELGIETEKNARQAPHSFRRMGMIMFDTKTTGNITTSNPFSEESTLKDNAVKTFPKDLFFVLRTTQLLRGLTTAMDVNFSLSDHWKPMAQEVLANAKAEHADSK